ncbi:MAG: cytochrome c3 family protein [Nitrospirae bacterium]|nr:cytochrome c3 family protein [Nitrospirota bacterium]
MKDKFVFIIFLLSIAALVYSVSRGPHQFSKGECALCHFDPAPSSADITADITDACQTCHKEYAKTQSHPSDIYPTISIPKDMPLSDGRLTCLTCHYAHIDESRQSSGKHYFLRRPVRGVVFCSACHKINEKRHIVFENIHKGTYEETDHATRIDRMSLECIQCHDKQISEPRNSLGAGIWTHLKEGKHPIGISYRSISTRKMRGFRPSDTIREEIKLYEGKIGCGTCHNVYSKNKSMLVIDNKGSELCLECHIK